jgi:hypothetical protein
MIVSLFFAKIVPPNLDSMHVPMVQPLYSQVHARLRGKLRPA